MPIPLSRTDKRYSPFWRFAAMCMRGTSSVRYLMELTNRFWNNRANWIESPVTLGEELSVNRHRAQRLLQIVAGDVRELLQLLVGAQQRLRALQDTRFQVVIQFANALLRLLALADIPD